jgi:predicted transcriptional regulator of viral defense system
MPVDGPDRVVLRRAQAQHGVVTARQLAAAGVGRHGVAHRVAKGWLRRLYWRVYLVGPLETACSRAMAAVLAYGDGALLSHSAAAVLWGIHPPPAQTLHVTVVGRDVHRRDGIAAHTTHHLHPGDATQRHGIPVTSAARTLLDLATVTSQKELNRAVDEARVHHLASDPSLNEQFRRYPTHRGTAAIEGSDPDRAGAHPVRSGAAAR